MKILAFAATTSSTSINRRLIDYATRLLEGGLVPDATVETIDLNDFEMPIYSIDRQEDGGIPKPAHDFFAAIGRSDAVLISFAEHNGFPTAAYKNLFDWTSRIDMRVYQDRPTVMLSTSIGPGGGSHALRSAVDSAPFFGNQLLASLSIPSFEDSFDLATGSLGDADLDAQFRTALSSFADTSEETPS